MSQDAAYIFLKTFGPMTFNDMILALRQSRAATYSSLMGLRKHGDAVYMKGKRLGPGSMGLWDAGNL